MIKKPSKEESINASQDFLIWLSNNPEDLSRFISLTGVTFTDIKDMLVDEDFLRSILEFVLQDENLLIKVCDDTEQDPEKIRLYHYVLSGAEDYNYY